MDEDEDEEEKYTFDYFNVDIKLLALHILLESFYRGHSIFTLDQFLKGDYWKIEEISDEIRDTNDYGSVQDMVFQQVIRMINDLEIGKIKRVSINDLTDLTETVIRGAVEEKNSTENEVLMYSAYIDEIYGLRKIRDESLENGNKFNKETWRRIDFTEDNFYKYINYISEIGSAHIELEVDFNKEGSTKADKEIDDYLNNFCEDGYLEQKPDYKDKRFYFSKQIENFFNYIKRFPVVGGHINIPFSSLSEDGFEIVKILSYLERKERIKVRNWNDTELWNVKFHKTPVTLASILGQEDENEADLLSNDTEIKLNLSFSHQTGSMVIIDENGKENKINIQGQVQKEVLRVVFQNLENTYSEWSLYDISETLGGNDVNEIAVKNAIYQFNRKVKLSIPEIDNLFILTKHSAQLNPKYINKN